MTARATFLRVPAISTTASPKSNWADLPSRPGDNTWSKDSCMFVGSASSMLRSKSGVRHFALVGHKHCKCLVSK
jgi:hypothetical protein